MKNQSPQKLLPYNSNASKFPSSNIFQFRFHKTACSRSDCLRYYQLVILLNRRLAVFWKLMTQSESRSKSTSLSSSSFHGGQALRTIPFALRRLQQTNAAVMKPLQRTLQETGTRREKMIFRISVIKIIKKAAAGESIVFPVLLITHKKYSTFAQMVKLH